MFDEIPDTIDDAGCDPTELILLHRAFRREFRLLHRQIRRVPAGDTGRAEIVARHADELTESLLHYLDGARELWRQLSDLGVIGAAGNARISREHRGLQAVLREIADLLPIWRTLADPTNRAELASAVTEVDRRVHEHFDGTERDVLPLVRWHVTAREWSRLREQGTLCLPRNRRLLFLARILEDASPAEESDLLSRLSPPRRLEYRLVGVRRRSRDNARLRQGLSAPAQL